MQGARALAKRARAGHTCPMFRRALIVLVAYCALSAAPARAGDAVLENTYWRLVSLNGAAVEQTQHHAREAHMVLHPDAGRFAATAGCNQMSGGYTLDGAALAFGPAMMTLMACPEPLMEQEQALAAALSAVHGWRIAGQGLELLDADGAPLAAFEAVYLK